MRRALLSVVATLVCLALPATGQAQEHAASPETLDRIAVTHADGAEAARAEVRAFLQRPEVRRIADEAGLDVLRAESAVATLSAQEVADLSARVTTVDAALAGGDSIVISTTAIIIGLLIVIIILVA